MTRQKVGKIHNHNIAHVVLLIIDTKHIVKVVEKRWKNNKCKNNKGKNNKGKNNEHN